MISPGATAATGTVSERAFAAHRGLARRQLHEGLDRAAGAAHGPGLEQLGDREEEHHRGRFAPLAQDHRADRGEGDENVDVERPDPERPDPAGDDVPAADDRARDEERNRERLLRGQRCRPPSASPETAAVQIRGAMLGAAAFGSSCTV